MTHRPPRAGTVTDLLPHSSGPVRGVPAPGEALLVVLGGGGRIDMAGADAGARTGVELVPHCAVRLPRNTAGELTSGPDGLICLTVLSELSLLGGESAFGGPERPVAPPVAPPPAPPVAPPPAPPLAPSVAPPVVAEEGGEAACLLSRVCADCGRLATERDARYCSRCGTALPDTEL